MLTDSMGIDLQSLNDSISNFALEIEKADEI